MILVFVLGLLCATSGEELSEEVQPPPCNCTQVLQSEEISTEPPPTFPTTSFTCWGRYDGYYADIEVDCTIFHYCQTWYFPTGLNETVKWDFACPQSTIFNQKLLSCTPPNISFDCQESPNYYWVNYNLTSTTTTTTPAPTTEFTTRAPIDGQQLIVGGIGAQSASFPDSQHPETSTASNVVFPEQTESTASPDFAPSAAVSVTEQPATASITEQHAAVSVTEQPATASITEQPATASITEQHAAVSVTEQPASVSFTEQHSAVSVTEQQAATSVTEQPAAASITEQHAAVSVSEQPSSVSFTEQHAAVSVTEHPQSSSENFGESGAGQPASEFVNDGYDSDAIKFPM